VTRETLDPGGAAPPLPPRGPLARGFDGASVAGFAGLWALLAARHAVASSPVEAAATFALLLVPALVAADLAAGLLHWFADTFFAHTTPVIGPTLIHAFRDHHRDPTAIVRRSVVEVSGQNCAACVVLLSLGLELDPGRTAGRIALAALLLFALAIALTNLFHRWSHAERIPPLVTRLQRSGFVLSPARHARHHSGAHDRAYCVTTGWLNRPLDAIGFFAALERAVRGARRPTRSRNPIQPPRPAGSGPRAPAGRMRPPRPGRTGCRRRSRAREEPRRTTSDRDSWWRSSSSRRRRTPR
jgi:ubiquitin-conjugating enzyme E2 variant